MQLNKLSVFSTHLIQRWVLTKQAHTRKKVLQEEINGLFFEDVLKEIDVEEEPHVMFSLDPNEIATDLYSENLYKYCTCPELRRISRWIGKNVIKNIEDDSYDTIRVKLRIATDMLNTLQYKNIISIDQNIYFHDNFVNNVLELKDYVLKYNLPFQYQPCSLSKTHVDLGSIPNMAPNS